MYTAFIEKYYVNRNVKYDSSKIFIAFIIYKTS